MITFDQISCLTVLFGVILPFKDKTQMQKVDD